MTSFYSKGRDYPTVKDWGARGDGSADDTAAVTAAVAAAGAHLHWPAGTYQVEESAGGVTVPDGQTWTGAGMYATVIRCADNPDDTQNTKLLAPAGDFEARDLTFAGPATQSVDANVRLVFHKSTSLLGVYRNVRWFEPSLAVGTWDAVDTRLELYGCVIDGNHIGLNSGQGHEVVQGINTNGAGVFVMIGGWVGGMGCNVAARPYSSNAIYLSPNTGTIIHGVHFKDHIQGRMIQFYNSGGPSGTAPFRNVIRDCVFGAYYNEANAHPYAMCEVSESNPTSYLDCHFLAENFTAAAVNVKGDGRFRGCTFNGTSVTPSAYLNDADGYGGTVDHADCAFGA